jgi:hypothetical protein
MMHMTRVALLLGLFGISSIVQAQTAAPNATQPRKVALSYFRQTAGPEYQAAAGALSAAITVVVAMPPVLLAIIHNRQQPINPAEQRTMMETAAGFPVLTAISVMCSPVASGMAIESLRYFVEAARSQWGNPKDTEAVTVNSNGEL